MDSLRLCLGVLLTGTLVAITTADGGACYHFKGTGRVSFGYNLDFSSRAHFKLKFKTKHDTGVLYYAEGAYQRERVFDYEGLFIEGGYLRYFLFNPGVYSMGSSNGFYGVSTSKVNDSNWHTAEFYRNREVETVAADGSTTTEYQTGLTVDGVQQAMDARWKEDVNIFQPISIGYDPHETDRSSPLGGFKGSIKDFQDVINDKYFTEGTKHGPVTHCIDVPDAQ